MRVSACSRSLMAFHSLAVSSICSVSATLRPSVPWVLRWSMSFSMGCAFWHVLQKYELNIFWKAHCVQW